MQQAGSDGSYSIYDEDDPLFWRPEVEPFQDPRAFESHQRKLQRQPIYALPSQFVHAAFMMPRADGLGYEKFSFEGRRHILRAYNTSAPRVLLTLLARARSQRA